uniref:Gluten hydrolyzing proteinase n=1 Tax=Eurygaster integriceps TaxID=555972 RepID=E3UTI2_9HEMI|nr:gluten hydrolyzing proteinase [Eurygaster integriceps]
MRCTLVLVVCLWLGSLSVEGAGSHETGIGSAPSIKGTTCPCGMSNKGRIVGGSQALDNEYPWMVKLVNSYTLEHKCGASIINDKVAITAAHCVHSLNWWDRISIIAGTSDSTKLSGAQIVPVASWIEHEQYYGPINDAGRTINDIALLMLAKPLVFNANVGPVCLPTGKINLDNKWVKLIGWGQLGELLPGTVNLMETDVQVLPFSTCQWMNPLLKTPQTQVCIKGPGTTSCNGDSGGPLTWLDPETNRYTLVGLVSFGTCHPTYPAVLTEVSAFLPWIKWKIGTLGCQKVSLETLMRRMSKKSK